MSDIPTPGPSENSTLPLASASPPRATSSRRNGVWLLLFALIGSGLAGWLWFQLQAASGRAGAWQSAHAALEEQLATQQAAIEQLRRVQKAVETRATENATTNRLLREELLAMSERASLIEDAVARLADSRVRGDVVLRLNEAEFLLLLGEERLRLFGDVPATIQAYTLADAALAGLDDPMLATLRQTLAQELAALRAAPSDPRTFLRGELAQLSHQLTTLPASRSGEVLLNDAPDSRLAHLLSRLVTVRRISESDALLGPVQHETALTALLLQLELAQAALARPDPQAFTDALRQADALLTRLFDAGDAQIVQLRERLRQLREMKLIPEFPTLGATLQELRGLRAMRSLGSPPPLPLGSSEQVLPGHVQSRRVRHPSELDSAASSTDLFNARAYPPWRAEPLTYSEVPLAPPSNATSRPSSEPANRIGSGE